MAVVLKPTRALTRPRGFESHTLRTHHTLRSGRSLVQAGQVKLLKPGGVGDELVPDDLVSFDRDGEGEQQPSPRRCRSGTRTPPRVRSASTARPSRTP